MPTDLFDAGNSPKTKRAAAPAWVIDKLVTKYGVTRKTAESWHASQAFAVLRRYEQGAGKKDAEVVRRERREELARLLTEAIANDDYEPRHLHDLINEALGLFDRPDLATLATVAAEALAGVKRL